MSKKSVQPQSRRHVHIFNCDWEFLEANFGARSAGKIGTSAAIRMIVHQKCNALRAKAQEQIDQLQKTKTEQADG